ncbi:N-acetylglucosamine kinase [Parenemella sanctibonifatiensis]|uniref:N-acetylglucosamine kinase n=1 Tax=Parenemella sanctibonifatiensis TaxID=2016505 RepID=UPI0015C5D297|nr:BadF/BadG/BcrA/BcrD ATPase family protein [Parenemella sanctibonifatiensis]
MTSSITTPADQPDRPAPGLGDAVLGIDLGGSSITAVRVDHDQRQVWVGRTPGANPFSSPGLAAERLAAAVAEALQSEGEPPSVSHVCLGASGAGGAGRAVLQAALHQACGGLGAELELRTDLDIAFLSGAETGSLLLSGTGAVAARYQDTAMTARCDGMGWMLGDEGSGLWIGWQAARSVAAALDGRGPSTALTGPVLAALEVEPTTNGVDLRQELVAAVAARRPADLARLAPIVLEAADPVAEQIVETATQRLLATLAVVDAGGPIVLAGGLLANDTALSRGVRAGLPDRDLRAVRAPVIGAVSLALAAAGVTPDRAWLEAQLAT